MARRRSGGFSSGSVDRWAKQERRRQAARDRASERAERARKIGRAAETTVTIVTAVTGIVAEPPVDQVYGAADAYEQARHSLADGDNRDEYLDEQTRAANDRKGGSGRRL